MNSHKKHSQLRLLSCIPKGLVSTEAAREMLAASTEIPTNEIEDRLKVEAWPYTETEFLTEQGVDVSTSANTALRKARDAANAALSGHLGRPLERKEIRRIFPALKKLREALKDPEVSEEQSWFGWETLMQACESLALTPALTKTVLTFVTHAVVDGLGAKGPKSDKYFDKQGSWGGPAPHVQAANAAMYLYSLYPSAVTKQAVLQASSDTFKPARAQVAQLLLRLRADASLMWRLAGNIATSETSSGVVERFVGASLGWLFNLDASNARSLLLTVNQRASRHHWLKVREQCETLFLWRALLGEQEGNAVVASVLSQRTKRPDAVRKLLFHLRSHMRSPELQDASVNLIDKISGHFMADYARVTRGENQTTPEFQEATGKNLVDLASELYFALDAHRLSAVRTAQPTQEDLVLFDKLYSTLNRFSALGIPSAVHRLLETLEFFANSRPDGVFDLAVAYIDAGAVQGFQYEYMGAQIAVRLMEQFLATQRAVIESTRQRREAFVRVLNTFALWPEALRLIYRFEEAFR